MAPQKEHIIRLEQVSKTYRGKRNLMGKRRKDVTALDRISLAVMKGEIFGLIGESGSGKTTAGRLITKLEEPEKGNIYLDGIDIGGLKGKALKEFRQKVQMIFQDPYQSLNPHMSVIDTVSEPLSIHRKGDRWKIKEMAEEAIKTVGLSPPQDYFQSFPHQLSGGQRQRVAIARAMVIRPGFVVADEPTSMLDASISAQIFNILLDMRDRFHVTIFFISHSLAAARYLCDRIAVIYRGNMVELGPGKDLINNPAHPYTKALIDALPSYGNPRGFEPYGTLLTNRHRGHYDLQGCPFHERCAVSKGLECSRQRPLLKEIEKDHFVACFQTED